MKVFMSVLPWRVVMFDTIVFFFLMPYYSFKKNQVLPVKSFSLELFGGEQSIDFFFEKSCHLQMSHFSSVSFFFSFCFFLENVLFPDTASSPLQ